jgi:hypothetical protein
MAAMKLTPGRLIVVLFGLVIGLWALWWTWGVQFIADRVADPQKLGQIGDLFGGVNALFAAFAFAGVAIAAYYQHLSWQLLSAAADDSKARAVRESFEPLFFQLLQLHRAIAVDLQLRFHGGHRSVDLDYAAGKLRDDLAQRWGGIIGAKEPARRELICAFYEVTYLLNEAQLGPYFRSLYHVFALVDRSALDGKSKAQYASIARSTLGVDALLLLAINCLTERGRGLLPYVIGYGLLKHARQLDAGGGPTVERFILDWYYEPGAAQPYADRAAVN